MIFDKIFRVEHSVRTFDLSYQFDRPTETSRDIKVIVGSESSVSGLPEETDYNVYETSAQNACAKCKCKIKMRLFIPKS